MERKKASDFDQELLNLYDRYAHGLIERREFLDKASAELAWSRTIQFFKAKLT